MIVLSVKHTGTRFTKLLFGCDHLHVLDVQGRVLDDEIIVPLRDPALVWVSWYRRGESADDFLRSWRVLADIVDKLNPMFLCVDRRERHTQLAAINARFGMSKNTNWKPVTEEVSYLPAGRFYIPDIDWIYGLPFMRAYG